MVHPIILTLTVIGFGAVWFLAMFGLFIIISIFKAKRLPMDASNRINHIRLLWFAFTRPELFVDTFAWLKNDELDNIQK